MVCIMLVEAHPLHATALPVSRDSNAMHEAGDVAHPMS